MAGGGKAKEKGETREVRISKSLTQVLRHKAVDFGLQIAPDGYILVEDILACAMVKKFGASVGDVEKITKESDKQRFEMKRGGDGQLYIRAVQGHSMKVVKAEELMKQLSADDPDLPSECVHGTYRKHFESIRRQGLKAGGKLGQDFRNHVHFAPYAPRDERVISGMRYDCEIAIWVKLREAILSGIPFFMSRNQVILTPGLDGVVPASFFERVVDLKTGAELVPRETAHDAGDAALLPTETALSCSDAGSLTQLDELAVSMACYRRAATAAKAEPVTTKDSAAQAESSAEVIQIESPAAHDSPATDLLTRLCWGPGRHSQGPFRTAVIYLHGFPDQSLDHRAEDEAYGSFSSRFPRKLAEAVLSEVPDALFVAFNFAGTPGSDKGCPFSAKTVSREVSDTKAVLRFLRQSGRLPAPASAHIVGISTGAIVAALLRGWDPHLTITAVAGLLDVREGLRYDFDEEQLRAFDAQGFCLKEFWLPVGSPSNPPTEVARTGEGVGESEPGAWRKSALRLGEQYRQDFLGLDICRAVRSASGPFLVVHGDADTNVPIANGKALFEAAAEPKQFVEIKGGNHLLSNTKHFQKAARVVADLVKQQAGNDASIGDRG